MPHTNNINRRKSVLDTQLAKKAVEFEATVYQVIDSDVPAKFKPTLVRQLVDLVSSLRYHCVAALSLDVAIDPYEKLHEFSWAQIDLRNVIPLLNLMNDMNAISNSQKAQLDILVVQILDNLARLIHSLRLKYSKFLEAARTEDLLRRLQLYQFTGQQDAAASSSVTEKPVDETNSTDYALDLRS